jgi:SIR2-like domain
MAIAQYAQQIAGKIRSSKPHKQAMEHVGKLIEAHRRGRLALVLGAGVSKEYGVPDWNTLLYQLMLTTSSGEDTDAESAAMTARLLTLALNKSPTVAARFIQMQTNGNPANGGLAFEERVRSEIYKNLQWSDPPKPFHEEVRLLALAAAGNPQLDCIITYNYDDLVDRALKSVARDEIPHKVIHGPKMRAVPPELAIYHVHGYLPPAGPLTELHRVVLAEADYHRHYANAFQWQNQVQIEKFAGRTCLFFGISLSDPNLRRLLDIARERHDDGEPRHFIVRRRPRVDEAHQELLRNLENNPDLAAAKAQLDLTQQEAAEHLLDLQMEFEQTDGESFGVGTIWVSDFDGNASILKAIRKQDATLASEWVKPVRQTSGAA